MIQFLKLILGVVGTLLFLIFAALALMTPLSAAGPFWTNAGIGLMMMFGAAVLHQLSKPIGPR